MPETMLEAIGITAEQELVYRALLLGHATPAEVAETTGLAKEVVARLIPELAQRGLVRQPSDGPPVALHPRLVIEPLITESIRDLEQTRQSLGQLSAQYHDHVADPSGRQPVVDVLGDDREAQIRLAQIERTAEQQIRAFETPPYAVPPSVSEVELAGLARGVTYRVLYARGAFELPTAMEALSRHAAAGEQTRVLDTLPLKLCIVDDRAALLAHAQPAPGRQGSLLVHASPLLTALIELFELNWRLAMPVRLDVGDPGLNGQGVSAEDLRLVTMLAAGLKDPTIGRHLGLSQRTVQRRVHALSKAIGARNRLELLLHFARRGLLPAIPLEGNGREQGR